MPSKIEWTNETWNPIVGCTKVSPGCANCYAERMAARLAIMQPDGPYKYAVKDKHWTGQIWRAGDETLRKPLHWKQPRMIFVNSMSDLFHPDSDPDYIAEIYRIMERTPQHTYQILTKRPKEALNWYRTYNGEDPLPNVWIGVSVENQKTANERIPYLLQMPATVKFLSCEPLLGLINLAKAVGEASEEDYDNVNAIQETNDDYEPEEFIEECEAESDWINYGSDLVTNPEYEEWLVWRVWRAGMFKLGREIDWIIVGGESGPNARPMHPNWARELRFQAEVAKVPFFFKQWGEYITIQEDKIIPRTEWLFERVGKKRAGHLLDGKEYRQFPINKP